MRSLYRCCAVTVSLFLGIAGNLALSQSIDQPAPAPSARAASTKHVPKDFLPVCSTEKVNDNCFVNIDRRYPVTMPTFQMRRGSHITVYVFHPFSFENLTLDAGAPQAYEGTDQASSFVTGAVPFAKGAVFETTNVPFAGVFTNNEAFAEIMGEVQPRLQQPNPPPPVQLAQKIVQEIHHLDDLLTSSIADVKNYFDETNAIYAEVREIESPLPRPVADLQNKPLRSPGVSAGMPYPFHDYGVWRTAILNQLTKQGSDTTDLLQRLPLACQKSTDPTPAAGLWLPPARKCKSDNMTVQDSAKPLAIDSNYDSSYQTLTSDLKNLPVDQPDADTYHKIMVLKENLDQRHQHISDAISLSKTLLPPLITKISTDMENLWENISLARDTSSDYILVGVIRGPGYSREKGTEGKILAPYKALAPSVPYTLNAQNQIANPLLGLPAASQKQAIVTITALYAEPRFEVSSGAFLSWLPNRTFSNRTDVTVKSNVPAPTQIRIQETTTSPPLVIPFVAANYRISPEFTWLGGRRGAVYATSGIALNPYNTQVEYPFGFSVSWRFLMISPLYHLGHDIHLTNGERVNQIWCSYGSTATSTSSPPACAGSPPAPSTKMFWTGRFALGISVRVPTTFSSTNH